MTTELELPQKPLHVSELAWLDKLGHMDGDLVTLTHSLRAAGSRPRQRSHWKDSSRLARPDSLGTSSAVSSHNGPS